ncbi:MAG: hypothetical protein JWQ89_475 [Devosia sp.]|uniref:hypothetical protein n=1 Tax=Devosia sp. TaxID=1871048 RepID=UPI00262AC83B|nr:hypothetical protein [Devosia sp.]MDB5538748.1 hypothetical protein [Devosia sp.]
MPKFMTYQRPVPVNKANWTGKPGADAYLPARKLKAAAPPATEPARPALPVPPNGKRQ